MKTSAMNRIYAMAMSAVFAALATLGVALLMDASGEKARVEFAAATRAPGQPPAPELTQWQAPAPARQAI